MKVRPEVIPFVLAALGLGAVLTGLLWVCRVPASQAWIPGAVVAALLTAYLLYFFRNPDRTAPTEPGVVVSGADGVVMRIADVREDRFLKADTVRISIFLSLFDVHVNRAPIAGKSTFLGYFPGKHFFTFLEKSSDHNQHNAILFEGSGTRCLLYQIVGPVARRVVYWPPHDRAVDLPMGAPIGMMKFGSRMDLYFPKGDVDVTIREGDRVRAGETIIARIRRGGGQ